MKLSLELTRDTHERPVVLATLEGGWPTGEECRLRKRAYQTDDSEDTSPPDAPYFGHNPRLIAGHAAGDLLGRGSYAHPVDELPNEDGALVFRGGPTTRQ